jgi:hypothetical protein
MFDRDTDRMEERFREYGIPPATSFAWPGSVFGPEAIEPLRARGYRFARRGDGPERTWDDPRPGPAYDPTRHSALLIPSAVVESDWTADRFARTLDLARGGKVVVLQFHGVPDPYNETVSTTPERFREFLAILAERAERVIALRDLAEWVDPEAPVRDPLLGTRFTGRAR